MDMLNCGDKLEMTEDQLHDYLRQFSDRRWHPKYHLDVDTINRSSGIWLRDAKEAHQLCALTHLTGLCDYLRLSFFKDKDTEKTLFTSGAKMPGHVTSTDIQKCLEQIRTNGSCALPTRTPLSVSVHAPEHTPKPNEAYRRTALRLQILMEQATPKEFTARNARCEELKDLKKHLRSQFQGAFGFSDDQLKRAERFYRRFRNTKLNDPDVFDHEDFFQHGRNLIIVSQPYGWDSGLSQWSQTMGASLVIAREWGYYYPGHATLFFVEFTPQAKAEVDKRLRK